MIKSSFSSREYLEQPPRDEDIKEKDGAFHIPIGSLEKSLDYFEWGTENFQWQLYKDERGNLGVSASIELILRFQDDEDHQAVRSVVGACNFLFTSMGTNSHWLATAKSECVKNAASDFGRKFGRGLNADLVPDRDAAPEKTKPKMKPDRLIMVQYSAAVIAGDQKMIDRLTDIYEIKTETNGSEII